MEHQKSVGLWVRVSTDMQGDSYEHHELRGRHYAEAKGWNVVKLYKLEAMSGKSVMGYAETHRMMEDIKKGEISGLIFSKLARLARNTKELLEFADFFKDNDADLISLGESIDTSTPAGRLFYTMIGAMAQWEREEISSRIAASVPIRAKLGKRLGGKTAYGYQWDGKQLLLDEKEAPVRKLVFELYLKLKRRKAVAREINNLGHRTREGSPFTDTTVERLISDTMAKGEHRANYTTKVGNKIVLKPESEWVIQSCPAVVDNDLWEECNRILNSQKKKQRVGRIPMHLLAGYVFCEACDKKMYVYHDASPNYVCRECKTRIPAGDLEEIYQGELKSFLMTDSTVSDYHKKSDADIKEREELLAVMSVEAGQLRKKMDDLFDMRLAGEMTKERFAEKYQPTEERLGQLEKQLPEFQAEVDFLKIQYLSSDVVLQEANDLYNRWPSISFEEKRTIIEAITKKIAIGVEEVTIDLAYLPSYHIGNPGTKQRNEYGLIFGSVIKPYRFGQPIF